MFYVYILKCRDNSLYTGITDNIKKRLTNHKNGNGSRYVRSRLPIKLVYTKIIGSRSLALKMERRIKSMSRKEKLNLLSNNRIKYKGKKIEN